MSKSPIVVLTFSQVKSHRNILALRLPEKTLYHGGQLLNAAQSAQCQALHVVFVDDKLARHFAFDVRPDLLIRIQVRRVRWQKEQFQLTLLVGDKALHCRRLMDGMPVDDQKDGLGSAYQ
jgi:hypothetical protein